MSAYANAIIEAAIMRQHWQRQGIMACDLALMLGCQPGWAAIERVVVRRMLAEAA